MGRKHPTATRSHNHPLLLNVSTKAKLGEENMFNVVVKAVKVVVESQARAATSLLKELRLLLLVVSRETSYEVLSSALPGVAVAQLWSCAHTRLVQLLRTDVVEPCRL